MKSLKFFVVFVVALFFFASCNELTNNSDLSHTATQEGRDLDEYNKNPTPPLYDENSKIVVDEKTGQEFPANVHRQILSDPNEKLSKTTIGTWSDYSGTVFVTVYMDYVDSYTRTVGGNHDYASLAVTVANDEVLVGGGAWTDWCATCEFGGSHQSGEWGAFITSSYPLDGALTTWAAESKSHIRMDPHKLYVYAVGLKLKKNDGNWMSRNELRNNIYFNSLTSGSAEFATAVVQCNNGYKVIGGGARVNYSLYGQLITESRPMGDNTWKASSKAHHSIESCPITSYVIGLNTGFINNYGYIRFFNPFPFASPGIWRGPYSTGTDLLSTDPSYVPTCIGALSTSDNGMGRLITGLKFQYGDNGRIRLVSQAKDHEGLSGGYLYTYSVQIQKQ